MKKIAIVSLVAMVVLLFGLTACRTAESAASVEARIQIGADRLSEVHISRQNTTRVLIDCAFGYTNTVDFAYNNTSEHLQITKEDILVSGQSIINRIYVEQGTDVWDSGNVIYNEDIQYTRFTAICSFPHGSDTAEGFVYYDAAPGANDISVPTPNTIMSPGTSPTPLMQVLYPSDQQNYLDYTSPEAFFRSLRTNRLEAWVTNDISGADGSPCGYQLTNDGAQMQIGDARVSVKYERFEEVFHNEIAPSEWQPYVYRAIQSDTQAIDVTFAAQEVSINCYDTVRYPNVSPVVMRAVYGWGDIVSVTVNDQEHPDPRTFTHQVSASTHSPIGNEPGIASWLLIP